MAYQPTAWRNNRPPAITAAALNKIEQGIKTADQAAQAAAAFVPVAEGRLSELESRSGTGGTGGETIKVGGSQPSSGWWLDTGGPEVGPPDTIAPSTPTGLTATATGSSTVSLAWTASTDDRGVAGYEYRIGTGTAQAAGSASPFTVTGLTAETAYSFSVRAFDDAGNRSGWSASASATTLAESDTTNPTPGTLAASDVTSTGFTVTVTGATDAGSGLHATPYSFAVDGGAWSAWQADATYSVTGLSPATTYSVQHRVRDAAGNEQAGTAITVSTSAPAPFIPAGATVITSDGFTGAVGNAGGRATDVAHGGSPVTPTETVAGTFKTSGSGSLAVAGTGRLMYALASTYPDAYLGFRVLSGANNTKTTIIRLRAGSSGSAAVMVTLEASAGGFRATLTGGDDGGLVYISPGDEVGVSVKGTTAKLWHNGAVASTATVAVDTGPSHVIVAASVLAGQFDNLVIADMSGAS